MWQYFRKIVKEIENVVSRPLSIIINQSSSAGIFPDNLKIVQGIPLYKKYYNCYFKLPSHILTFFHIKTIWKGCLQPTIPLFSSNGLLYESQYRFRKLHSTELDALEFTDRINQATDAKKIPFSIFLDLSKAFDTLDYNALLSKLDLYGTKETALNWFRSYLINRTQYVDMFMLTAMVYRLQSEK